MDTSKKINAVQRMQGYIENHLYEHITLQKLADEARYSPWYASRLFKELTGKAPAEYIRMVRLSKAALKLRDEKVRIADVALDFMFGSQEGFTRAFSKEFGISPAKYAKLRPPIKLFIPFNTRGYCPALNADGDKGRKEERKGFKIIVFVQVMERPERKLIVKRAEKAEGYLEYCEEAGSDVWGILTSIKEALYEPIGMWLPDSLRKPGTSKYVQGVEVPSGYSGIIPEGFELIALMPCKMMIFQGLPYVDEKFQEVIEDISELIKKYNPETYGLRWADEDGPRFQLAPMGNRGYIEGRPVKQLEG